MHVHIVVKDSLRHRLFLRMAEASLKGYWQSTTIVSPSDPQEKTGKRNLNWRDRAYLIREGIKSKFQKHMGSKPLFPEIRHYHADDEMQKMLGIEPLALPSSETVFRTEKPNCEAALDFLRSLAPDLILIYGAPLLSDDWLTLPRLGALNMHYGILPHYRSGHSTEFALLHERPDRIGASIHYVDRGVDTGQVVHRSSIVPVPRETGGKLLARVYVAGAEALINCACKSIKTNERLPPIVIERSEGMTYFPKRTFSRDVSFGVEWRRQELDAEWPNTELSIEKRSLTGSCRPAKSFPPGVYILLYHSLTDEDAQPWEHSYIKVATPLKHFSDHIDWLKRNDFHSISLADAPEVLRRGSPAKRYFAVTFDDAYSNIVKAQKILDLAKVSPTVFVNGAFSSGRPYFRALAAVLRDSGGSACLKKLLDEMIPSRTWSSNPDTLFNETKDFYVYGLVEEAVLRAYSSEFGDPNKLHIHLNMNELRSLKAHGWSIGNHTWDHPTLSALSTVGAMEAIDRNLKFLRDHDLDPINWLSYPNGLARHVGPSVKTWLDINPTTMGVFAGGGVNFFYSRTQWLRIPIGSENLRDFEQLMRKSVNATLEGLGLSSL